MHYKQHLDLKIILPISIDPYIISLHTIIGIGPGLNFGQLKFEVSDNFSFSRGVGGVG